MGSWADVSDAVHILEKLKSLQMQGQVRTELAEAIEHLEDEIAKALKSLTTE